MKVIIAPDSYKGSISAKEICLAIENGITNVFPQAEIHCIPLADGGEGTLESMVFASHGTLTTIPVNDPLGKEIKASYGILGDRETVIIEMAQASGLPLVKPQERNPYIASSFGTGQLIKHALDAGYRKFIIGLGGSATNDAGTGMLMALGLKLYDEQGELLPQGGGYLSQLARYDDSGLDPRLAESTFTVASDVVNRLCGPEGASAIFGPQKGATEAMVTHLDQSLSHFADIVFQQRGVDMKSMTGGGAAGGMGAALITFLGAAFEPGIQVVMNALDFEKHLYDADLIITGEGKLDAQTLSGKVIAGVAKLAQSYHVPVVALCGGMDVKPVQFDQLGILSAFSIVPGPCSLEESMSHSSSWMIERTESLMRVIHYFINREGTKIEA